MTKNFFLFIFSVVFVIAPVMVQAAPAEIIPNDPYWSKQWYLQQINAPEAWAVTTGTRDVIVAVIDGGVDITHPDLKDNIWTNDKEIPGDGIDNDHDGLVDDVHGWNFITNSPDVGPVYQDVQLEDVWDHGTIVSSLIGAKGNDGIGMAGVAWNVRLMPLVVLDGDGQGGTDNIVKAISYAVSHGAKVINMSLAGYDYDQNLDDAVRDAANAGVVIVAATGNDDDSKDGINTDKIPVYPACSDGTGNFVIGVGGTDTLDQKAPYANYGKNCTDISAPAQEMFAARPSYPHGHQSTTSSVPLYTDGVTGTSLAAPLVSGVAALLWSLHPDWTAAQIKDRIISTAHSIENTVTAAEKGKVGGRLDARLAVLGSDADVPVVKTVKKTKTGYQFDLKRGSQTWRWSFRGTAEKTGWVSVSDSTLPEAYALVKDKKGAYTVQTWNPETDQTTSAALPVRGAGPWTVRVLDAASPMPSFLLLSKYSSWTTLWSFGNMSSLIQPL